MRLKEDQIARLAERVLEKLITGNHIVLKGERGKILERIKGAIAADVKGEETLEKDAERLLEQTLRSLGGGSDIDRHKMLRMIKERLAKERGVIL